MTTITVHPGESVERVIIRGRTFVEYAYRMKDGSEFQIVAPTVEQARARRDRHLADSRGFATDGTAILKLVVGAGAAIPVTSTSNVRRTHEREGQGQ